jgi:hypothetical protein
LKVYKFNQLIAETNKQNVEFLQHKVINKFLSASSLEEKNMAEIIKFIYLMVLIISLFLVLTDSINGKPFFLSF